MKRKNIGILCISPMLLLIIGGMIADSNVSREDFLIGIALFALLSLTVYGLYLLIE